MTSGVFNTLPQLPSSQSYPLRRCVYAQFHPSPPIINCVLLILQLLSFATDELAIRVGEVLAGLLSAALVRALFPLFLLRILRLTESRVYLQGTT